MKKLFLTVIAAAAVSLGAFAQTKTADEPKKTPEERAQIMTDRLAQKLQLNEDQKKQVYEISLDREKGRKKDIEKAKENKEERIKLAKERNKTADARLKGVLTPEQYKKLQDHRKEMAEKRKQKQAAKGENGKGKGKGKGKEDKGKKGTDVKGGSDITEDIEEELID